jgi:hypothetical protein
LEASYRHFPVTPPFHGELQKVKGNGDDILVLVTLFHSRSIKMLSIHRPLPSMLIEMPFERRASVNVSVVNWVY